ALTVAGASHDIDWHPSTGFVAFAAGQVYSWDGATLALADDRTVGGAGRGVHWHPDGDFIAFAAENSLALVDAWNGTALSSAATYNLGSTVLSAVNWHPDGNVVAFGHGNGPGNINITVLDWNG